MSKLNSWMLTKVAAYKNRQEEGQGLAEYGLILALVAVACIVALTALGTDISARLTGLGTSIN